MIKIILTLSLTLATLYSTYAQNYLSKEEVIVQRFGKEILYKDMTNSLLDGHYKIGDSRGNYSDLHFVKGKKDGESLEYDYKGRLLKTCAYKNGKTEGKYTTFHQNGTVNKEGYFVNGEENGTWNFYNDTGDLMTVENYKDGKKDGKWWRKIYYGQYQTSAVVIEHYKDDSYYGHAEEKSEDGKLHWEREYTTNFSYQHKGYYPNGQLYVIKLFKDGKLEGEKVTYNQDGVLESKMMFVKDQLQQATKFYSNGNTQNVQNYSHGKKDGLFQKFSEFGVLIEEGYYKDDYQHGMWNVFNKEDGSLVSETNFVNGVKNNLARAYNKANRISKEGNYKNGVKDGVWKQYDLAGKLTEVIEYTLGKEISRKVYK